MNHNTYYYDLVLRSIPPNCKRALDAGCGRGLLTHRMVSRCAEVIGIDSDPHGSGFVQGDVMSYPFEEGSFDFIAVVATLHHLPLIPALTRFRDLLAPGGVLAIVGLYRARRRADYAVSAVALPVSWILRGIHGHTDVGAPLQTPKETLGEIKAACDALLPGAILKRRLLFRYSLVWTKR